jgi:hypothetical protein
MKMKALEVRDSEEPPITPEILAIAEKELGVTLPEGYRQFLLLHNGGCPKKNTYALLDSDREAEIYCFYSIYDGENGANLFTEIYRCRDDIPSEFIPIGYDGGGSQVCLGVRPPYVNQVYFWDFDKAPGWMDPNFGAPPTMEFMYPLASSFEEFINKLYHSWYDENENGQRFFRYTHDRYSLPFAKQIRQYGKLVTDFFGAAPESVKDFIMEEPDEPDWWHLWYEDPETKLRHHRVLYPDGRVEDSIGDPPASLVY